jgi:hypothetical protein
MMEKDIVVLFMGDSLRAGKIAVSLHSSSIHHARKFCTNEIPDPGRI